jgi:hypothetical protein
VNDQPGKPINEVFPCPWFAGQAAVKQVAVDVG